MTSHLPKYASEIERRICAKLINHALMSGYVVSVYDGEVWTVKKSDSPAIILEAMASTDSDKLAFRHALTGAMVGQVVLIWGNDNDLISDTSVSDEFAAFLSPIEAYAEAQS
jgi:hypothetical protein